MRKIFWGVSLAIVTLAVLYFVFQPHTTNSELSGYSYVRGLKAYDGTFLGDLYVKYVFKEAFTDLRVVGADGSLLYLVTRDGFYTSDGKLDADFAKPAFGFVFQNTGDDWFILYIANEEGRGVSDPIRVGWNYYDHVFEEWNFLESLDIYESCDAIKVGMDAAQVNKILQPYLDNEKYHTSHSGSLPEPSTYILNNQTGNGCGYYLEDGKVKEIEQRAGSENRYYRKQQS